MRLIAFVVWTLIDLTTSFYAMLNWGIWGCVLGTILFILWIVVSHKILNV